MSIMDGGTVTNLEVKDGCGLFQRTPLHSPGRTEENQEKDRIQPWNLEHFDTWIWGHTAALKRWDSLPSDAMSYPRKKEFDYQVKKT